MMKDPENLYSFRLGRLSPAEIDAELAAVQTQMGEVAGKPTPKEQDLAARRRLLLIEQRWAQGNQLFQQGDLRAALAEYQAARDLIAQQVVTGHRPGSTWRPTGPLTMDSAKALLAAGLDMVDLLLPDRPEVVTTAADRLPTADPALPPEEAAGLRIGGASIQRAQALSESAAGYAERGQWARAESLFRLARRVLGNSPGSPEQAAAAAIELNLGAVLTQAGQPPEAEKVLQSALRTYRTLKDPVGQAQAHHNLAVALVRGGKAEEARTHFEQAEKMLTEARGTPGAAEVAPTLNLERPVLSQPAPNRTPGGLLRRRISPRVRAFRVVSRDLFTTDLNSLTGVVGRSDRLAVTYRFPGGGAGWHIQPLEAVAEAAERLVEKTLDFRVAGKLQQVAWRAGSGIPADDVIAKLYRPRTSAKTLVDLTWRPEAIEHFALQLPHLYGFALPLAIGDCQSGLGDFAQAEAEYLLAAGYTFINQAIEVPLVWRKLAENALAWGDSQYRNDDPQGALPIYTRVIEPGDRAPANSPLYTHPNLKITGDVVKAWLANYRTSGPAGLNPALAAVVLEIRARAIQIEAGLDFLGVPQDLVPIFSFEYLQNVARQFAAQAAQAEREFIQFTEQADQERLSRLQLSQAVELARSERELARRQQAAAQADLAVYRTGEELAQRRRQSAEANRATYADLSWEKIWVDGDAAWYTGPGWRYSDRAYVEGTGKEAYEILAENAQRLSRMTRDYELGAMERQIAELQIAEQQAAQQVWAARARAEVTEQMVVIAGLREQQAQQSLQAFDSQFFTADTWAALATFMRQAAARYLNMATRVARDMERAYNFENDTQLRVVKPQYLAGTNRRGLLAADALIMDIDSFTHDFIVTARQKAIPIKQTISLAERFAYQMATELRTTGRITFDTRLEDFEIVFPGVYQQRLEAVEIEVQGIVPQAGLKGLLSNLGLSRYRKVDGTPKFRFQPPETLVLSEYRLREDAIVFPVDPRLLKVFEGAGVAGTWQLEFPRAANDIDFSWITDVRITFHYWARYNATLAAAQRAAAPEGLATRSRSIPLRFAFPDAFFRFQSSGELAFTLGEAFFPLNQRDPQIKALALLVPTRGPGLTGLQVRLATPSHPEPALAAPDVRGAIAAAPGHPWQPLCAGSALGEWRIEIQPAENPALVRDGQLDLSALQDLMLILEYTFQVPA